jgi:hypothetical protein
VHTHLKGRIVPLDGQSYLVLHDQDEASDWLKVRSLGSRREIKRVRHEDVEKAVRAALQA